ncbi:poly-specific ribonuclease parn-like domain-containing protein 1-like [Stylonychia lemnae]|uniref:Poly-specific ribonuclease parn-like domain-containing protein 1-like n=1 Tax=Stylonychia lemnae TaxID=5949 RepID=A0A078AE87_STYLE|nr:poly-specific ribonuclease parn-like domain-containing protein 1-like [Stylonychia lemnae]|eukprot:CDW79233.1 poly-specific ribonuclease parn-like domain-containing protein 1-like [Stylonychia lemnae]
MEITIENFEEKLEIVSKSIKSCEFISFDCEFSGSKMGFEDKPHEFDSLDDKYRKNRHAVQSFLAFQVGLTTFIWSSMKKKYIGRPFNFLVYPRHILKERYHYASIWIGILIQILTLHQSYEQLSKRKEVKKQAEKYLFKEYELKHYQQLSIKSQKVEFSKESDLFMVHKLQSNDETGTPISMSSFTQNQMEIQDITDFEIGFSKVIEELINSKKPLVGHNMLFDMMFLYQQFIDELPPTLKEFVAKFPLVYDTKAIASNLCLFNKTDLNSMSLQVLQNKKFKNYLEFEFDISHNFVKYQNKCMLHEAGYDSYLTGIIFASLVKYLETQAFYEYQKNKAQKLKANAINTFEEENQNQILHQLTLLQMQDNGGNNTFSKVSTFSKHYTYIPSAQSIQEIANSQVVLESAYEFKNYIMIALEGQKYVKLEKNLKEDFKEFQNVLFIQLKRDISAFDLSKMLNKYGDVYVVKDTLLTCFAEFTYFDGFQNQKQVDIQNFINTLRSDEIVGSVVEEIQTYNDKIMTNKTVICL